MQRDVMRDLIRTLSRVGSHDVSNDELDLFLDEGYSEVVTNRIWSWGYALTPKTVTMVSGTDTYVMDAAVKRILAVVEVDQGYPLEAISQTDWARRKEGNVATSTPVQFTFTNGSLHLWPVPGVTDDLAVYYYEHPTFGAAANSEPVFDSTFHSILVDWAMSRIWETQEDFEKSDDYRQRFEIKLVRMGKFYNSEVEDRPMIFGDRHDFPRSGLSNMPWLGNAGAGGAV